ncbi:MAG: choice-of-anchor D domain-containing protein [Myxococcales bacterium]|nr:choice-of-anchor D domain-containing protein [Myxococcales bacterium]
MKRLLLSLLALAAASCDCGGGVSRVKAQLVPPPEAVDFGTVPVLNERLLGIEVTNAGRAVLKVKGASIREEGPFSLKSIPEEVGTSETKQVEVSFVPPREEEFLATLVLETEDEVYPTVEVKLSGRGSTRAVMEVEPSAIDFGRVGECTSAVRALTIRSKGTADLVLNAIRFADGTSPGFSSLGSWNAPVAIKPLGANGLPGQIQLTVRYTVSQGDAPANGGVFLSGTDPDRPEMVVPLSGQPNRAPLPSIQPLGNGAPGMTVSLDGSASSDPDGDAPLSYKWTLRSKPLAASTQIVGPEQPQTSMTLDPTLPGEYEVELNVTDAKGVKNCAPARAKVVATPAQKLLIELFWSHPKTDIDLHVLRTPTAMVGQAPDDCFYANPKPDWGVAGDSSDDPELLRDALTGYGPELLGYVNPADGSYRVVVEFAHDHLDPNPSTEVTVRIYEFGVVKAELKKTMLQRGEVWPVADIDWPSGTVTRLQ